MAEVHFAPFGAEKTMCGQSVPANLAIQLDMQDYSGGEGFTVRRERVTCQDCQDEIGVTPEEGMRVPIGTVTVTYYIDVDGKRRMAVAQQGDLDEITMRGMLDVAKDWIVDAYEDGDDEAD